MTLPTPIVRRRYGQGLELGSPVTKWADDWLKVLLRQDGSATLLCETVANGPVRLDIVHQAVTTDIPRELRVYLSGEEFIERQVCISGRGEVMMDNLSYAALSQIDAELRFFLEAGISPIGHIFDQMWTRKQPVPAPPSVQARLWERSGLPDPPAARSYLLETPSGPCMLITETFRYGMRLGASIV